MPILNIKNYYSETEDLVNFVALNLVTGECEVSSEEKKGDDVLTMHLYPGTFNRSVAVIEEHAPMLQSLLDMASSVGVNKCTQEIIALSCSLYEDSREMTISV